MALTISALDDALYHTVVCYAHFLLFSSHLSTSHIGRQEQELGQQQTTLDPDLATHRVGALPWNTRWCVGSGAQAVRVA